MADNMREAVVEHLDKAGGIPDSLEFAKQKGWDHDKLVGVLKSLEAQEQVTNTGTSSQGHKLSDEALSYSKDGSPECQVFALVKGTKDASKDLVEEKLGKSVANAGISTAMKNKWISIDKSKTITAAVDSVSDDVQKDLLNLTSLGKDKLEALKKRKLIATTNTTTYCVAQTDKFSAGAKKDHANLTEEMIRKGTWSGAGFKALNFDAGGLPSRGGHLHPLSKVRTEIRTVMTLMGFQEMETNRWVESSFWNFDSLFQPQQHPARDSHDTFFVESPCRAQGIDMDYLQRVRQMHEKGGMGSIGWRYDWSEDEARRNILRTHTTAVSARTLCQLAEDYKRDGYFTPKKYFSIDRVFRNETLDATHLAEFHQVEGLVADRNLGLGHLIGVMKEFFARVGITKLRFKPAYNPYTEPSMEVFGFHPTLKKWIEVGNSGVFRPEMLLPMGLPEDVSVVAWGIGLERWAALLYNVKSIKDLFSFQQDIASSKRNPVCWLKRGEFEE
jgi:phenylalanyl-tRNA synthetase alpha chain